MSRQHFTSFDMEKTSSISKRCLAPIAPEDASSHELVLQERFSEIQARFAVQEILLGIAHGISLLGVMDEIAVKQLTNAEEVAMQHECVPLSALCKDLLVEVQLRRQDLDDATKLREEAFQLRHEYLRNDSSFSIASEIGLEVEEKLRKLLVPDTKEIEKTIEMPELRSGWKARVKHLNTSDSSIYTFNSINLSDKLKILPDTDTGIAASFRSSAKPSTSDRTFQSDRKTTPNENLGGRVHGPLELGSNHRDQASSPLCANRKPSY